MAPHPILLLPNLFSGQTQLVSVVPKPPSKSQGEFVDRNFSFKCGVKYIFLEKYLKPKKFQKIIILVKIIRIELSNVVLHVFNLN